MNFDSIITIAAFGVYLIFMICVGMYFMGKSRTTSEYFLGGRQLGICWCCGIQFVRGAAPAADQDKPEQRQHQPQRA